MMCLRSVGAQLQNLISKQASAKRAPGQSLRDHKFGVTNKQTFPLAVS